MIEPVADRKFALAFYVHETSALALTLVLPEKR
jgi:hypothetical protein